MPMRRRSRPSDGPPGFSAEKLALFLLDPHPKMPNMELSRREAADLADYIAKLER